jgi:protein AIR1/2
VGRTTKQLKNSAIHKEVDVRLEDGELPPTVKPTNPDPRNQRKRKKSQQDPATTKGENEENGDKRRKREDEGGEPSRANSRSPPDRATRRRALREKPSDSLFFVDDEPADIRDPYVAGPSRMQQIDGLVLPPHVKVAEGSSEVQEPSFVALSDAEGGEEDFIDYLDVDGDRSVCISRRAHAAMYANSEMKDRSFSLLP